MEINQLETAIKSLNVCLETFNAKNNYLYQFERDIIAIINSLSNEIERNNFIDYLYDALIKKTVSESEIWRFTRDLFTLYNLPVNEKLVFLLDQKLGNIEDIYRIVTGSSRLEYPRLFYRLIRTLKYYRHSSVNFNYISQKIWKEYKYLSTIKFISCEDIRNFDVFVNLGVFENLKHFTIWNSNISENDLSVFCKSSLLKQLETLRFGNKDELSFSLQNLKKLMLREDLTNLKKLEFHNIRFSGFNPDKYLESIVFSPIMKNLESLALTKKMINNWYEELEFLLKHLNYDILNELIIHDNNIDEDKLLELKKKYQIPETVKILID